MLNLLNNFIKAIDEITRDMLLFEQFADSMKFFDFDVCSYHMIRKDFRTLEDAEKPIFHNFPTHWVNHYLAREYFLIDPIIGRAKNSYSVSSWFRFKPGELTPVQEVYLEDLKKFGFKDGLGVPVFGPDGETAYFGVGSFTREMRYSQTELSIIHLICHHTHARYNQIKGEVKSVTVKLSPREKEALGWVAKGKSNAVIADIIGISEHTVDTLLRRIFHKFNVGNRTEAVLKAANYGMIEKM